MTNRFLASCETEALHQSGAILPDGTALVVDSAGWVTHVGANVLAFVGGTVEDWLGSELPPSFSALVADLPLEPGSRLQHHGVEAGSIARPTSRSPGSAFDIVTTRSPDGGLVFELLSHQAEARLVLEAQGELGPSASERAAAEVRIVELVAALTGFERVMLYRFREDGDGEVVAEARRGDVFGSYLGLRFPASDIPRIARALYLLNPWRLIPDATCEPVPLMSRGRAAPDLTYADLRSVSPVHRAYLANMGVRASLSFPVVLGTRLDALIACHHASPQRPSLQLLTQVARVVREFSFARAAWYIRHRMSLLDGLERRFAPVRLLLARHGDISTAFSELGHWLLQEFGVDGVTLCIGERILAIGLEAGPAALVCLDDWLAGQNSLVWRSECLWKDLPEYPPSEVAGAVAMRVGADTREPIRLFLLRREQLHEVEWGGNPDKPVEYHDGGLGIAPRRSFERWVEKRIGHSRPWDAETHLMSFRLRELLAREAIR